MYTIKNWTSLPGTTAEEDKDTQYPSKKNFKDTTTYQWLAEQILQFEHKRSLQSRRNVMYGREGIQEFEQFQRENGREAK